MKTAILILVLLLTGCASTGHDYTLFCAVQFDGKCLQVARFERLYSVQQIKGRP